MSATLPHDPPRISGRLFVWVFVAFVVLGSLISVYLAKQMRPATMDARKRAMPLSGTVQIHCLEPGHPEPSDVRKQGTCSTSGKLEFSLPNPGMGVQSMTYALIGRDAKEPPITGQFPPQGKAEIDLHSVKPDYHVAVFVYADQPVSLPAFTAALQKAPAGDVPAAIHAIEEYSATVMHSEPKKFHEVRTARVELKVTP